MLFPLRAINKTEGLPLTLTHCTERKYTGRLKHCVGNSVPVGREKTISEIIRRGIVLRSWMLPSISPLGTWHLVIRFSHIAPPPLLVLGVPDHKPIVSPERRVARRHDHFGRIVGTWSRDIGVSVMRVRCRRPARIVFRSNLR